MATVYRRALNSAYATAELTLTNAQTFMGLPLPLALRLAAPITNQELMTFSRQHGAYRIERNAVGELEIMSPINPQGGEWEAEVIFQLGLWNRAHGGHVFSSNSGFMLRDGAVRSPDASWIAEAVWRQVSVEERQTYAGVCPEFLIEILSKSDSRKALEEKMQMWVDRGAELAWMLDPFAREVLIYMPGTPVARLHRPQHVEATSIVPGFRLEMARLWAE